MRLADETILDLKRERQALCEQAEGVRDESERIAEKIAAIDRILVLSPGNELSEEPQAMAARVRRTCHRLNQVVTPKDVAEAMIESGFVWDRDYDLSAAVGGELGRLSRNPRKNGITKLKRGQYRFTGNGGT